MKKFNSYTLLVTLLVCIIIFTSAFTFLIGASDNATAYIKDIQGDRSVLDDVTISGVIQDMYHGLEFEIENTDVRKNFKHYKHVNDMIKDDTQLAYSYNKEGTYYDYQFDYIMPPDAKTTLKMEKGMKENGDSYTKLTKLSDRVDIYVVIYEITNDDMGHQMKSIRFNTGVKLLSENKEYEFTKTIVTDSSGKIISDRKYQYQYSPYLPLDVNKALTILDGELYFTILTGPEYVGKNGVYKIDNFKDDVYLLQNPHKRKEYGDVKTIASFSLDERNIRILGLETVGDKLVLIIIKDNFLTLQAYDPSDGTLIDEKIIKPVDYNAISDYRFFSDGNKFNIGFIGVKNDNDMEEPRTLIVSGQLDMTFDILHIVNNLDIDDGYYLFNIDKIYEVNDKLFVFSHIKDKRDIEKEGLDVLRPLYYIINVYKNDTLLYKGELINDSDEDYVAERKKAKATFSYGYNSNKFRRINSVEVKGR